MVTNITSGEYAELDYYRRTMFGNKADDIHRVRGSIFTPAGQPTHKFEGRYSELLGVKSMGISDYGKTTWIYRPPKFVPTEQETKKIWGMNMHSLQMNHLPDELRKKLPPSDTRLRPD